jgi:hypothetical protein
MPRARPLSAHSLALAGCVGAGRTHCCVVSAANGIVGTLAVRVSGVRTPSIVSRGCRRGTERHAQWGRHGAPGVFAPLRFVAGRTGDSPLRVRAFSRREPGVVVPTRGAVKTLALSRGLMAAKRRRQCSLVCVGDRCHRCGAIDCSSPLTMRIHLRLFARYCAFLRILRWRARVASAACAVLVNDARDR